MSSFFTSDQLRILYAHLSASDTSWPYLEWMLWARLANTSPFARLPKLREALIAVLAQSPAITLVVDARDYLAGRIGTHAVEVQSEARVRLSDGRSVFVAPRGTRLDVKRVDVAAARKGARSDDLAAIGHFANAVWGYLHSPNGVAEQLMMSPIEIVARDRAATVAAMPRKSAASSAVLTISQKRFLSDIVGSHDAADIGALLLFLSRVYNFDIALALALDDGYEPVEAAWKHTLARREIEAARIARTNDEFLQLGLYKRICTELDIPLRSERTPEELLAALNVGQRQLVVRRYEVLNELMTASRHNACVHTHMAAGALAADPERWIDTAATVPDKLICKLCGLVLMCPHSLAMYNSEAASTSGIAPLSAFMRRQGRLTICKICGEVVGEDLLADYDFAAIQDPNFRRMAYGRYMLCKMFVKGLKPVDPRVIDFIYEPLFEQYAMLDELRGVSTEHREALQRVYADIYLLVAFGFLGQSLRAPEGAERGSSAIDLLLLIMRKLHGRTLTALSIDNVRLNALVATAAKALKLRFVRGEDAIDINSDLNAVNSFMPLRYVSGGAFTSEPIFRSVEEVDCIAAAGGVSAVDAAIWARVRAGLARVQPAYREVVESMLKQLDAPSGPLGNAPRRYDAEAESKTEATDSRYTLQRKNRRAILTISTATATPGEWRPVFFRGVLSMGGADVALPSEQKQWAALMEAGISPCFTMVNAAAQKAAESVIRAVSHELFIEAFTQICPATIGKVPALHDWVWREGERAEPKVSERAEPKVSERAEPHCAFCGGTPSDIYKSDAYFTRYESAFADVEAVPFGVDQPVPASATVAWTASAPLSNDEFAAAIQPLAEKLGVSAKYLFSLGDLAGRTYEATRLEEYEPRYNNPRYSLICAYYQRSTGMLGYYERYDSYGSLYRDAKISEFRRAHATRGGGEQSLLSAITENTARFMAVSPRMEPPHSEAAIKAVIASWCADMMRLIANKPTAALGEYIAREILAADKLTAFFDRRDYVVLMNDEMDNDSLDIEMRRETYAHDAFYQDFLFEGGEDQIALQD